MKRFLFNKRLLLPLVLALCAIQGWAQNTTISTPQSITSAAAVTESFTGFAGSTASQPTYWAMDGTGSSYGFRGTGETSGSSGGWYGSDNMAFLGSGNAKSGTATWALQNNTGRTITSFVISFKAFLFKSGSASPVVSVSWVSGTGLSAAAFPAAGTALSNSLASLSFSDATTNISSGATLSQTVTGVSITNGQYILIRFIHPGNTNSDNLGWDDVSITPTLAVSSPTVTTTAVTSITSSAASSGGNVTSDGGATISERGIVYATTANPTTSNTKVIASGTTGSYTSALSGLNASTTYHVRAYAINSSGTSYGSDVSFATAAPASAATDYFRSGQNGNWGTATSWQSSSDGSTNWNAATLVPDNNAASITIQNGHTIVVAADVTADNLVVAAGGTLTINSGKNLTINNGSATDLDIFGIVNNSGVITPTNASIVIETSGALNLLSASPTATGAIGNVGTGSVTGTVTVQQNLTAQRAYRLLGHPFTTGVPISALQPYVDITGSGNGLTAGNASAFNYTTGVWSAYTDNTQTWDKNEALFLFVRGVAGQGIGQTTGTYTPSAPTISLSGSINTGSLNYTVKSAATFGGAATGWNAIGNPYPAPIDVNTIGNITGPGGTGASIYVWNATMGATASGIASGGYDFHTLGSSFVIPVYGAFFINNTAGTDQVISFTESNKNTGTTPYASFGAGTTTTQSFLLTIADSLTYWDKLKISFGDQFTTAATDRLDMDKFSNINLDFYSIASDNKHLAINSRPVLQSATDVIALGLKTNQQRTFTVTANEVNLPQGSNVYLHDKYTNHWMKIDNGMSYNFSVTADTASQGNNRFEVAMKASLPSVVLPTPAPSALTVQAGPNPLQDVLTITYASPEVLPTNIRITDVSGKTVSSINAGKVQGGTQQVATTAWSKGVYVIQVNNGKETVTKKVVKE